MTLGYELPLSVLRGDTKKTVEEVDGQFCLGLSCSGATTRSASDVYNIGGLDKDDSEDAGSRSCQILLDEFEYWSKFLDVHEIREIGKKT